MLYVLFYTLLRNKVRKNKTIFLLIGPKGSGKSFIGTLFEKHFNVHFVRVEDWAKEVKKKRNIENETYVQEVFIAIEEGIKRALDDRDALVFESTGLTEHFDRMLANLKAAFHIVLIKIEAPLEICLTRVRTRDPSIHIDVSDNQVNKINELVRQKDWEFDFVMENSNATAEELRSQIEEILKSTALYK
jgi:shikimate kinase